MNKKELRNNLDDLRIFCLEKLGTFAFWSNDRETYKTKKNFEDEFLVIKQSDWIVIVEIRNDDYDIEYGLEYYFITIYGDSNIIEYLYCFIDTVDENQDQHFLEKKKKAKKEIYEFFISKGNKEYMTLPDRMCELR